MSAWGFAVGWLLGLIGFLNFIFCHKTGKNGFRFKLSLFLHSVANQNFIKKANFLIINKAKIESNKKKECGWRHFSVLYSVHSPATFSAFSCYIRCILVLHSVYSTVKQHTRARQQCAWFDFACTRCDCAVLRLSTEHKTTKGWYMWFNFACACETACCELISRRERDVIQTLFSIHFFSVRSKPKKDGDFLKFPNI